MIGNTRRKISRPSGTTIGSSSGHGPTNAREGGNTQSSGRRVRPGRSPGGGPQIFSRSDGGTRRAQSSQTSRSDDPRGPRGTGNSIAGQK